MTTYLQTFSRRLITVAVALTLILLPATGEAGRLRRLVATEVTTDLAGALVRQGAKRTFSAVEHRAGRSLGRAALRDLEKHTGRRISQQQEARLVEAMKQRPFRELDAANKITHAKQYDSRRLGMIRRWETHYKESWPRYGNDVYNADGELIHKAGKRYDLHHIIPKENGGPNTWWNSIPAASPGEHQGGLHGAGTALDLIQKLFSH